MNKKILALLAIMVVLGSVYQLTSKKVEKDKDKTPPTQEVVDKDDTDKKDEESEKTEDKAVEKEDGEKTEVNDDKEASRVFDNDTFVQEETGKFSVHVDKNVIKYGLTGNENVYTWHFDEIGLNEFQVKSIENAQELLDDPNSGLKVYEPLEDVFPEGMTFDVVGDTLTLRSGEDVIGVFQETK